MSKRAANSNPELVRLNVQTRRLELLENPEHAQFDSTDRKLEELKVFLHKFIEVTIDT